MRIYYAHCIAIYNTRQEERDVALLEALGFTVINPNDPEVDRACRFIRHEATVHNEKHALTPGDYHHRDASAEVMDKIFKPLATTGSEGLAFRALPDGRIPAGVAKEVAWAKEFGNPVFELPSNLLGREMTIDQTREYLREVGQR